MILDLKNQIASAYAPTAETTTLFPLYIDRLAQMDDGKGMDLIWYVRIGLAFTTSSSATLQLNLIGNATDPTFASGNVVILASPVLAVFTLLAGYELKYKLPRTQPTLVTAPNMLRYLTGQAVIGTGTMTAGNFDSWITPDDPQDNLFYPRNYNA